MDIEIKVGKSVDNFKALKQEIKSLRSDLVTLDSGSKEYSDTLAAIADKTRDLNDLNRLIRNSAQDLGQMLTNTSKVISGCVAGFSAAQAAMGLFGSESEDLQKTMLKVQQAIQLVQGLEGLEDLTKTLPALSANFRMVTTSVKGFVAGLSGVKKALLATGLGALVVVIGELVANWDKITQAVSGTKDETERYKATVDELKGSLKSLQSSQDLQISLYEAEGRSITDVLVLKRQMVRANLAEVQATIDRLDAKRKLTDGETEQLGELRKMEGTYYDELQKLDNDATVQAVKDAKDRGKASAEESKELKGKAKEAYDSIKSLYVKIQESSHDEKEKAIANYEAQLNALSAFLETVKKGYGEKSKAYVSAQRTAAQAGALIEKQLQENLKAADDKAAKDKVEKVKDYVSKLEGTTKSFLEVQTANIESTYGNLADEAVTVAGLFGEAYDSVDYSAVLDNIDAEIQKEESLHVARHQANLEEQQALVAKLQDTSEVDARKAINDQLTSLRTEDAADENAFAKKSVDLTKKKAKQEQAIETVKANAIMSITSSLLASAQGLFKENTVAYKVAASAQAAMDTYKAANASYAAMAGIPTVGPALGAAAAAAAVVAGIVNVKKIWAVDSDKGDSGSGAATSTASTTAATVPSYTGADPMTYTRNVLTSTEQETLNTPTKVYVLESDITDAQKTSRVRVQESTF